MIETTAAAKVSGGTEWSFSILFSGSMIETLRRCGGKASEKRFQYPILRIHLGPETGLRAARPFQYPILRIDD